MPEIVVFVRPQDQGGWVLGEDLSFNVDDAISLTQLKLIINEQRKHVSPHRMQFRLSGQKLVSDKFYEWTLRRHGIHDEYLIFVEPTLPAGWLWNSEEYYIERCLDEVALRLIVSPMELKQLAKSTKLPPFLSNSLRSLLRQYPERFHLTVNGTSGEVICALAEGGQLPSWNLSQLELQM